MSSRHVARVFEIGEDEQGIWLVTELIDGVWLSVEGLGRALLPHEVLRVARGVLEGLSVAHAAGVIHADVKPSNILVPRTEKALDGPKLIDFGLARVTSRAELARELGESAPGARRAAWSSARRGGWRRRSLPAATADMRVRRLLGWARPLRAAR